MGLGDLLGLAVMCDVLPDLLEVLLGRGLVMRLIAPARVSSERAAHISML